MHTFVYSLRGTNAKSHWFPCMFFKRFPFIKSRNFPCVDFLKAHLCSIPKTATAGQSGTSKGKADF